VRLAALKEVGPSVFFSLLVIAVGFLPIFALEEQEGRLFKPLAYTKTFTMAVRRCWPSRSTRPSACCSRAWIRSPSGRGRWRGSRTRWPSGATAARSATRSAARSSGLYERPCRFVVRHRKATIAAALGLMLAIIPLWRSLGSEFMPPLWEGDLLYMPITMPGISVTQASDLLGRMDRQLMTVPEVARVHGKAGRAETSTDPAPLSMMETVVQLKPPQQWRARPRWYDGWPEWSKDLLRPFWPDRIPREELLAEIQQAMQFPGTSLALTMPIKGRIDMLTTGIRTPLGVKVMGDDVARVEAVALQVQAALQTLPDTQSAFAERAAGGYFLDFDLRREQLARHGLTVEDAERTILAALGGEEVSTTIEGRERYGISVRYARELRDEPATSRACWWPRPPARRCRWASWPSSRCARAPR
jgi:Cu(I)/Ag(I) efflux system membrane protein CusA/SilA